MSENKTSKSLKSARVTAGTVIGMGLLASIAGNVQSILLEDGNPSGGALLSAVWWPALLFAMIHLALTIPWGTGKWQALRWTGPTVIGGLAFYISFFHLAHVLSYYGYDMVSRYAGPLTVDVAMFVATIAWHRVGVAIALANEELASVATQDVASTEPVATGQDEMASLAADWATLDTDLDEELANMITVAKAAPEPVAAPAAQPAQEPAADRAPVALTTVPAEAAKRIQEILAEAPNTTGVAIAKALMDAGLASSEKTGRRYAQAIKNNTARVS